MVIFDDRERFHSSKTIIRMLSNKTGKLNICHINGQSLINEMDEFRDLFEKSFLDVICVSETWFSPNMPDNMFKLNGFKLMRADRIRHAGGNAIRNAYQYSKA